MPSSSFSPVAAPRSTLSNQASIDKNRCLAEGIGEMIELSPGLILHRINTRHPNELAVESVVLPGLLIVLAMAGKVEISIGSRRLNLSPSDSRSLRGVVISVSQSTEFWLKSEINKLARSIILSLSSDWLKTRLGLGSTSYLRFRQQHLSVCPWQLSARATNLSEQLLSPPDLTPSLLHMHLESRTLDLVVESLSNFETGSPTLTLTTLRRRDQLRMESLRQLLDSGKADALSLEEIAKHVCVSVNTLQRHFRSVWGVTVVAYLRESRLTRARQALEQEGVSVAYAAWLGGYSSPTNFATAFRRRYGISPRQASDRRKTR